MLHDSNPNLLPIQKQVLKESVEAEVVKQFTYGLHPTFRCKITSLNPRTLCEAIIEALKIESDLSLWHAIPVSALPTYNMTTEMGPRVNLASKEEERTEITNGAQGAAANEKRCLYCDGRTGLSVEECRRLMALINDRKTDYNNGPSELYNRNDNYYNRNNNYNNRNINYNTANDENSNYNNRNTNYNDRNDYNNRYNNYNHTGSNYYFNHSYGNPHNYNNGKTFNLYKNNNKNQDSRDGYNRNFIRPEPP
ncbi:probable ATP-dependent RNA helicase ddx42 [Copidosoma floridanum]|nr:probable ATP-dependent RNA helicase ddx42 [Copidosoma floridanum]